MGDRYRAACYISHLDAQVAKNCLLQGVGALVLCDPTPVVLADTGANFFLSTDDVGRPRDAASRPRLQASRVASRRVASRRVESNRVESSRVE